MVVGLSGYESDFDGYESGTDIYTMVDYSLLFLFD